MRRWEPVAFRVRVLRLSKGKALAHKDFWRSRPVLQENQMHPEPLQRNGSECFVNSRQYLLGMLAAS